MRARLVILMLAAGVIVGVEACGAPKANAVKDLFAQFGWIVLGEPVEGEDILPAEFKVCPGFPWRVYVDLSKDAGLDFSPLAGARVKTVRFRVEDSQGERLKEIREYLLWGVALLDQEGKVVGAWLTYTDKQGSFAPGIPGYSLQGKTLEE
ncbi:MAG: DUF4830 domain-containing protein [Bacillota bacterium]|nr:DUF4830 domain-containing protein [Bacillota bacterium]